MCGSIGEGEGKTPEGIILGHAYTIIDTHIIKEERVLEMRNPWGDENEWNGRWSDLSSEWTADLKVKYNMEQPEDDGRFFMPFLEFLKFFNQVSICFYEEEFKLSSFTDNHESKYLGCYEFKIETPGNYYVSLS